MIHLSHMYTMYILHNHSYSLYLLDLTLIHIPTHLLTMTVFKFYNKKNLGNNLTHFQCISQTFSNVIIHKFEELIRV